MSAPLKQKSLVDLKYLYYEMLRIRLVEEAIAEKYAEQEMRCPTHLSIGQEAVAVGVSAALKKEDLVYSGHRAHAHYLAKGGHLNKMIAELYGKATGCCGGRGGSMHLMDLEVGFAGCTPIVGSTVPLPLGAAWSFQYFKQPYVAVGYFGDACFEEGVVHETLNYGALKKLPVIFICENNGYSVYTPLHERQPDRSIASIAQAHGWTIWEGNGNQVEEVFKLAHQAVNRARQGEGPQFIELKTYRHREHCGPHWDDDLGYRPPGELKKWLKRCPLETLKQQLKEDQLFLAQEEQEFENKIKQEIAQAFEFAQKSPPPPVEQKHQKIYAPSQEIKDKKNSTSRELTYSQAINEALHQALDDDPHTLVIGEGVPDPKAIFGTTQKLQEIYGPERVLDMPLSENGLTGICLGAALNGLKPIMIHQRIDFALLALDQIINNIAKWHYMFDGQQSVPLVIRLIVGRGWGQGPQHSQSLQALFAHIPGLKTVMPSTAYDAKGMLLSAIADPNPVIFIEHRWLHAVKGYVPEDKYYTPLDQAQILHEGTKATLVASSYMAFEAFLIAQILASHGIDLEVIDLRSLNELDTNTLFKSVKKTGHLIVLDTGWLSYGVSAEIISRVTENLFDNLKKAPLRLGLADHPVATSPWLANATYLDTLSIAQKILSFLELPFNDKLAQSLQQLQSDSPQDVPNTEFKGPF